MDKQIVQSLWIGSDLTNMEIMCMKSFLKHNYDYHLYIYDNIKNIPDGVTIKDGNDILDKSEIYAYNNTSFSAISNRFRFELLYKNGGVWVDTDVICLKHYNFDNDKYLIVSEPNKKYNEEKIGCNILKFPKNDPILLDAIEICKKAKEDILMGKLVWGLGPSTTKLLVDKYNLKKYVKYWYFSNSCSCHHAKTLVDSTYDSKEVDKNVIIKYSKRLTDIPENTYFIHLWNEFWRRENIDKNGTYNNSLYQDLINHLNI